MKSLILTLALTVFAVSVSQAQIKRQYRDQSHLKTTVVVKDGQATSDIDVLNSQFDLADVSMNDVIMITTEKDRPKVETTEIAPATPVVEFVAEAPVSRTELPVTEVATTTVEEINVPEEVEEQQILDFTPVQEMSKPVVAPKKATKTKRAVKSTSKKSKSKKYKKKRNKRKRIKLKKRRKVSKRNRMGCYRF